MKKTTLVIAIITILSMNFYSLFAQDYKWYLGIGVDMKMAIEGPYAGKPNISAYFAFLVTEKYNEFESRKK